MDMPTKIAGRYLVREEIGRGGMGVVYRAQDEKFDAEVAVKVLSAKNASADAAARLKREAKLGNLLGKQDGLVRALDWGRLQSGAYYLVIDFVAGAGDLDLRQGNLMQRVGRVYEAAELVRKAHTAGVLHRDIKPANFLVDVAGKLHLTDFGIAKRIGDTEDEIVQAKPMDETQPAAVSPELTAANVGLGTPYFMPPEQFENAAGVDVRADVYALGVMLFLALTGEYPFPGKHPAEVYGRVMKARYGTGPKPSVRKLLRTIPVAIDRIVHKALAPIAEERYPTVGALIEALDEAKWKVGLAGVSPLVNADDSDSATVAFPSTGGGTRAPRPVSTTNTPKTLASNTGAQAQRKDTQRPTQPSNRCPGCGHEPLHGDLCPSCGADVIALRTQSRLEFKRVNLEREEAERRRAERRAVSGSGLDYGGFQVPKIAWFVIGMMVIAGIVLNVDWSTTPHKDKGSPNDGPPLSDTDLGDGEPTDSGPLVDAEELTDPDDLDASDLEDYELFVTAHESWITWNTYDNVEDPKLEVLAEVPELEDAFESYTLRYSGEEPETRARTQRYSFRCVSDGEVEVRERVRRD